MTTEEYEARIRELEAQRDALLKALVDAQQAQTPQVQPLIVPQPYPYPVPYVPPPRWPQWEGPIWIAPIHSPIWGVDSQVTRVTLTGCVGGPVPDNPIAMAQS